MWFLEGLLCAPDNEGGGGGNDDGDKYPVFLSCIELAEMLKMSPRSLEKMRLENRGPSYFRLGQSGKAKVLYNLQDVLEWLKSHKKG